MDGITDALVKLFRDTDNWTTYLLAVSGLGTLTMAILQAIKDTTDVRRVFQRARMRQWLANQAATASVNFGKPFNSLVAEHELVLLATNGDAEAFYDLEIEKLCGQWNAAVQVVTDYPHKYRNLFGCMAALSAKADFDKMLNQNVPAQLPPVAEALLTPPQRTARLKQTQKFVEARTRVSHQLQRAVDAFQISTSFRWKWILQLLSFLLSFTLSITAMALYDHSQKTEFNWSAVFVSSAIAGFLAPVARDLMAAVQKLRVN